jgi:transcription antitermination factor NusB
MKPEEHLDRRTIARELAMQALCQLDVQGDHMLGMLRFFFNDNTDDPLTLQLAEKWTIGAWEYVRACDDLIAEAAVRWKLSRLSHVDRAILRLSVYQLKYCPDIPSKVVLNEAIEIGKKYSTEQSPRFINGVLDAVLKTLKPAGGTDQTQTQGGTL